MRAYVVVLSVAVLIGAMGPASAAPAQASPTDLDKLFSTLRAPNATESPRTLQAKDGYVRFLGAPPGTYFVSSATGSKSVAPDAAAKAFVTDHFAAFGQPSTPIGLDTARVKIGKNQSNVRLQQTYSGLPVFGAQMMVQTDAFGGIVCVLSDILRDTTALDNGTILLTPSVSLDTAKRTALSWEGGRHARPDTDFVVTDPERVVFDPGVVGASGSLAIAWKLEVADITGLEVKDVVFVDGHSGIVIFDYPLIHDAKNRQIYDAHMTTSIPGTLIRAEGDPESDIFDVNQAYDYYGATYDFYWRVHGRDSIDNHGMAMVATVRIGFGTENYENAAWIGSLQQMIFGSGFAVDDVVGHELTHGVTENESGLIYAYQPGAMNESFSDIWGEYVDLTYTNGFDNDSPEVRWLMGEDVPSMGAIRNMKNPPEFGDPDRVGSPYYYKGSNDNGGVHWNSGVINKFCYLLTDGDTFNGQTVKGRGIETTAKLFYELQTNLLTPASDFTDLYMLLGQATINLNYSLAEQLNAKAAAKAVEIAPDTSDEEILAFRAIPTVDAASRPVIYLSWTNPTTAALRRVIVVRDTKAFPAVPSDGIEVYRGLEEEALDAAVVPGTQYYYTIFSQVTAGFPDQRSTRAIAGTQPPNFLTEEFTSAASGSTPASPFDMAYSQILFSPVGPPTAAFGDDPILADYTQYTAMVTKNVFELPVPRDDAEGSSFRLTLKKDGIQGFSLPAPFPYFGIPYSTVYFAANGYISFKAPKEGTFDNIPEALKPAHFAMPRIAFLFADLAPDIGGVLWGRALEDRIVLTFEDVPEMDDEVVPPSREPNTVQVELFYSGQIRFTYLGINAKNALVGLSDGQGMPMDPGQSRLFPGLDGIVMQSDFSTMPQSVTALSFEPVAVQTVDIGAEATFTAKTRVPAGSGTPVLSAEWDATGLVPFADSRDGTGVFRWRTTYTDYGVHTVRLHAVLGAMEAYQDVTVYVGVTSPLPDATRVVLKTNDPVEDPRRDRLVDDDVQLIASYDYSHPGEALLPEWFAEGPTQVLWFKNNGLIPGLNDQHVVTPVATKPNERWFYVVTPRTISGPEGLPVEGLPRRSPVVTIAALPRLYNVALPQDLPAVIQDGVALESLPKAAGTSKGGTTVVILGKRLGHPVSVTFGGIEAESIHAVSDFRIEAVTPAHMASPIVQDVPVAEDVVVTTASGTGTYPQGFNFVDSGEPISKADVNRDGLVNALDVQLVINAILAAEKSAGDTDVNRDGATNSADIQFVVNTVIGK